MSSACPLPYPEKFKAAAKFWKLEPAGSKKLSQENQLLLYALNQQATVGPNNTPKPWGWGNVVESTKWQGWKELGKMSKMEAMRLFVKTLDEEQPDWWTLVEKADTSSPGASGPEASAAAGAAAAPRSVPEQAVLGVWTQLEAGSKEGGRKPLPRYEAAGAVVGSSVVVLGGNYGGRYLSDCWSLDLADGTWSAVPLSAAPAAEGAAPADAAAAAPAPPPIPAEGKGKGKDKGKPAEPAPVLPFAPTAGHSVTAYGGKLYVLGGHTKAKGPAAMGLRVIDLAARTVHVPEVNGTVPPARGGHTATLLGSKVWVFAGEDAGRKALGDVHVLDLDTLTWSSPEVSGKAPLARSACAATAFQDRYIVVFGGGSVATCFNDVHVLDTQTLAWSQPAQAGAKVSPRAGHTGAVLGDVWYIVGGGNNVKGCADLLAADLSQLAASGTVTWHVVASVALRDPLSSEGIALVALPAERVLLAFGGYNGKYQSAVSIFRAPEGAAALLSGPVAVAAARVEEAKAAAAGGKGPAAAAGEAGKTAEAGGKQQPAAAAPAALSAEQQAAELQKQVAEFKAQLEGARKDAESAIREAAAAKEGAAHELSLLRKQVTSTQGALADANKALEEARAALAAEQAKVLKLEAQAAELQAKLGQVGELHKELDRYRRERAAREAAEQEAAAKKGSGGFWGYVSGTR